MYRVDTSAWVHTVRPAEHVGIRALLKPLMVSGGRTVTEWILLELMTGLLASERKERLLRWFIPIARLSFKGTWWDEALDCAARLRKRSVSPPAAGILIATVAITHRVALLHCDADFEAADFEAMEPALPLQTLDLTPHLNP